MTLTAQQAELRVTLDTFLDTAGAGDETFRTDQGVLTHPGWVRARMPANTALDAFGWETTVPPHEELVEDQRVRGDE